MYAITYPKRLANEDVNPSDEAFHRRLDRETDDNGADTEGGKRGIPIDENNRYGDYDDSKGDDQMHHALERETNGRIFDATERIDGNSSCNGENDHGQQCPAYNSRNHTEN